MIKQLFAIKIGKMFEGRKFERLELLTIRQWNILLKNMILFLNFLVRIVYGVFQGRYVLLAKQVCVFKRYY